MYRSQQSSYIYIYAPLPKTGSQDLKQKSKKVKNILFLVRSYFREISHYDKRYLCIVTFFSPALFITMWQIHQALTS